VTRDCFLISGLWFIVSQHSNGRGIKVVKLSPPRRPNIPPHRRPHDHERQRQHHEDDTHASVLAKLFPYHELNTTVTELNGIMIAAMSGLRYPVTASATPIAL